MASVVHGVETTDKVISEVADKLKTTTDQLPKNKKSIKASGSIGNNDPAPKPDVKQCMADGVWRDSNPRMAVTMTPCERKAVAATRLLASDHWFFAGYETTKALVDMCTEHDDQYKRYVNEWKCTVDGCNNKGFETFLRGCTQMWCQKHLTDSVVEQTDKVDENVPASCDESKPTTAQSSESTRRGSAPATLEAVRELTGKKDHPKEEEVKKMLKAYSFDEDVSEDEQPTVTKRTTTTSPVRRLSAPAGHQQDVLADTNMCYAPRRQVSHDQLWNPGTMVESDVGSEGETSDEEEGWMTDPKPKLSPTPPSCN